MIIAFLRLAVFPPAGGKVPQNLSLFLEYSDLHGTQKPKPGLRLLAVLTEELLVAGVVAQRGEIGAGIQRREIAIS
jgi:hypothetical protein